MMTVVESLAKAMVLMLEVVHQHPVDQQAVVMLARDLRKESARRGKQQSGGE